MLTQKTLFVLSCCQNPNEFGVAADVIDCLKNLISYFFAGSLESAN